MLSDVDIDTVLQAQNLHSQTLRFNLRIPTHCTVLIPSSCTANEVVMILRGSTPILISSQLAPTWLSVPRPRPQLVRWRQCQTSQTDRRTTVGRRCEVEGTLGRRWISGQRARARPCPPLRQGGAYLNDPGQGSRLGAGHDPDRPSHRFFNGEGPTLISRCPFSFFSASFASPTVLTEARIQL